MLSFYLKDHQGNNRVLITQGGSVEQVNYYPFGGLFGEGVDLSKQSYRYNGKELDRMHGLNWYDYGGRMKDDWGFTTVDPLCEKYYSISPYAYCFNNPIRFVDPDGRQGVIPIPMPIPFIPNNNLQNLGQDLETLIKGAGEALGDVAKFSAATIGFVGLAVYSNMSKSSPEFQNQRQRERRGREEYDQNRANMANSIEANAPSPTPDGNSDLKRELSPTEKKVITGVLVAKGVMIITNPNPAKDDYDAHVEKVENRVQSQKTYLEDKKVYEIEQLEWTR